MNREIQKTLERAQAGQRLSPEQGLLLFDCDSLPLLAQAAHAARLCKTRPDAVTYVVDRNINYTNVCVSGCRFCAFYRSEDSPEAYVLSYEDIGAKVAETIALGGRQILLQGGLHPSLRLEWYEGLLRYLKAEYGIYVHGFSAPEIAHAAKLEGLSIEAVLGRLIDAGLDSIPGGGAEILSESVRHAVSPRKGVVEEWLAVHRAAHRRGLRTTATMMFGHVESLADRIEHFERIRQLQDETSGFTAFISWTFQPGNTELEKDKRQYRISNKECRTSKEKARRPAPAPSFLSPAPQSSASSLQSPAYLSGSHEYLKTLAISRLYLDNLDNFQASWVTQGAEIGQVALMFGCNDFGSTMIEENVVRSAGCSFQMDEPRIRRLISEAGFTPLRRDYLYRIME